MNTPLTPPPFIQPPLTMTEIAVEMSKIHQASRPGKVEDGTRIHIHYKSFGKASDNAKIEAARASELGLPRNRYTGRISKVWISGDGSLCLNMFVELERDHKYRTMNLSKGKVFAFTILGD